MALPESRDGGSWDGIIHRLRRHLKDDFLNLVWDDSSSLEDRLAEANSPTCLKQALQCAGVKDALVNKICVRDMFVSSQTLALAVEFPLLLGGPPFELTPSEVDDLLAVVKSGSRMNLLAPSGDSARAKASKASISERFLDAFDDYSGIVASEGLLCVTTVSGASMQKINDHGALLSRRTTRVILVNGKPPSKALDDEHLYAVVLTDAGLKRSIWFDYATPSSTVHNQSFVLMFNDDRAVVSGPTTSWQCVLGSFHIHETSVWDQTRGFRIFEHVDYLRPGISDAAMLQMYNDMQSISFADKKSDRRVEVSLSIKEISNIVYTLQSFDIRFTVVLAWKLTKDEWMNKIACPNGRSKWKPLWEPPPLKVLQSKIAKSEGYVSESPDGAYMYRHYEFKAEVRHEYDLRSYPFDMQILTLAVAMQEPPENMSLASGSEGTDPMEQPRIAPGWIQTEAVSELRCDTNIGTQIMLVHTKVKREFMPYFWKYFLVLGLFAALSLVAFTFSAVDNVGIAHRLRFLITLFLAAVAFQLRLSGELPQLRYLTVVDVYTAFIFVLTTTEMAAGAAVYSVSHDDINLAMLLDYVAKWSFGGVIGAFHVGLIFHCFCILVPRERRKQRDVTQTSLVDSAEVKRGQSVLSRFKGD